MRYTVLVKFNPTDKIQVKGNEITVSIRSKPERGRANKELMHKLAKYFDVSQDKVYIISGFSSTKKQIEIAKV
jgi:uncharacterized protein